MKRKTFLTFGAIAAVAVIGAASIPAIAGGGPWGMMGGRFCRKASWPSRFPCRSPIYFSFQKLRR